MAITDKRLYRILTDRLHKEGWETNAHFVRGTRIPYTRETTSRAFDPHPKRDIANDTLFVVLKYLNYSKGEIANILKKYTDDSEIWPTINTDGPELSKLEESVLKMVGLIKEDSASLHMLANALELVGKAAHKDFSPYLGTLRRGHIHVAPKKGVKT